MNKREIVIKQLIWDEKNVAHIALHDILPSEVEDVCQGDRIERTGHKNRIFLIGQTQTGRMLSVILNLTDEAGVYYPVTAYEASKKSIQDYQEEIEQGGEEAA